MPPKSTKSTAKPAAKPAVKKHGAAKPAAKPAAAKAGAAAAAAPAPAPEPAAVPMGETIGLKIMAKYVFENPENELAKSGRWPLITDEAERATTFLRYRDVNMLNVVNEGDMAAERIRMGILGALRFGKPIVFDFMTADVRAMYPKLVEAIEAVKPGLMKEILSKQILKEDCYKTLYKDGDDENYQPHKFNESFLENFKLILVCATKDFPPEVIANFFVVTIE